jgi:cobalt/nickel transport system ATP-binding protein
MLLKVENIHFEYPGGEKVLKGAGFSADRGEVVAIIGPNGSGKTTLLMVAAGLLEPKEGVVLLGEKPLKDQLTEARRKIGLVFQDPNDQLFNPTVYDEIAFAPHQLYSSMEDVDRRVKEVAEKFGLKDLLSKPPYKLSVGEKRMVTLASVVAYDPEVLLLDEPTANLSSGTIKEIKQIIEDSRNKNKAVVVASHDVEFVADVSDRVYIINDGSTRGGIDTKAVLSDESLLALADMRPPLVLQTLRLLRPKLRNYPITIKDLEKAAISARMKVSN